jgi:hypothetical protein
LLRVTNPDRVAFSILVALESQRAATEERSPNADETESLLSSSILLGDLGVYPSDQPGRYRLEVSSPLKHLLNSGKDLTHLRLRLALKLLHPKQSTKRLEVVLSSPEWTREAR